MGLKCLFPYSIAQAQVVWALDLVGGANVAIVGLNVLTWLKEILMSLVKIVRLFHTRFPPKILMLI
jgi:hypothetical protein